MSDGDARVITITYETPEEAIRLLIAEAEKLGFVAGSGVIYDEGTHLSFTTWTVDLRKWTHEPAG